MLELAIAHELYARYPAFSEGRLAKIRSHVVSRASCAEVALEHGFADVEEAVVGAFAGRIEYALTTHVDHKTELQEALARTGRQVAYVVLSAEGPPHERHFTCAAMVDGARLGSGEGRSKKAAEHEAAKEALARLDPAAGP